MYCTLTMERNGWIQPEQQGPSHKTWSNIIDTNNSTTSNTKSSEYIPLSANTVVKNILNSDKTYGGKRKRTDNLASTRGVDVAGLSSEDMVPWKPKGHNYPDGVVGYVRKFA